LRSERFWLGQHFVWFTTPLEALVTALRQGPGGLTFVPDAMAATALVGGIAGMWLLARLGRQPELLPASGPPAGNAVPASWWVYTVGSLLVAYSAYFTGSILRYSMVAFPLFVAFAWYLPRRAVGVAAALMLGMQACLLLATLTIAVHPVLVPLVP
jgi:hypothetical protein